MQNNQGFCLEASASKMKNLSVMPGGAIRKPTYASDSLNQQLEQFRFSLVYFQPLGPTISSVILGEFVIPSPPAVKSTPSDLSFPRE